MNKKRRKSVWATLFEQKALLIMSIPLLLYQILFKYIPIYGWSMAFQKFKPGRSMWEQEWVGFDNFKKLFTGINGERFIQDIINTLGQSILTLVLGTVFAIILALMLNEVKDGVFKRVIQNITYMPHFLSWIIVAGIVSVALSAPSSGGFINSALLSLHIIDEPIQFLSKPEYFWGIAALSHLWKELGWNTILYLAAITAIDPSLYEAAEMDGAGRFSKIWNITLPGIRPTIVILLIMSTGYILEAGFEIPYFLGNGLVVEKSETIDVFVMRYGYQMGNYSLAVVAGMFKTVVGIIIVGIVNFIAGRLGEETLI
ncbi:ABC transporter permease [Variimorphobacter saccharofermentans]|nr:ABC transporter permease subunit [Variimorphobacter saccharofermentans]